MEKDEFTSVCRSAESGTETMVQNLDLRYTGRVVACHEHFVTVETFGHCHDWDAGRCQRVSGRVDPLGPPTNR